MLIIKEVVDMADNFGLKIGLEGEKELLPFILNATNDRGSIDAGKKHLYSKVFIRYMLVSSLGI